MKDIDFDELDRAVSSVLGQKDSPTKPSDDAADNAVDVKTPDDDSSDTSNQPLSATDEPTDEGTPTETDTPNPSSPTTPLATKRRGKFMDVIHPSADMSTSTPALKPVRALAPLTPTIEADVDNGDNAEVDPVSSDTLEPVATTDENQTLVGAEPPLLEAGDIDTDVDHSTDPSETEEKAEQEPEPSHDGPSLVVPESIKDTPNNDEDTSSDTVDETVPSIDTPTTPGLTPFLTDTKVDKRPLGAFGVDPDSVSTPDETGTAAPADTQTAPEVPLPRELQPDVVEVEAVQENEGADTLVAATPFSKNIGPAPEPSEDDRVEGHPLFDTSTYHEPIIAVPGKSMPAWVKWLIGLVVCLVIGAGVGYFLFTAGL